MNVNTLYQFEISYSANGEITFIIRSSEGYQISYLKAQYSALTTVYGVIIGRSGKTCIDNLRIEAVGNRSNYHLYICV